MNGIVGQYPIMGELSGMGNNYGFGAAVNPMNALDLSPLMSGTGGLSTMGGLGKFGGLNIPNNNSGLGGGGGFFSGMVGTKEQPGWGNMALGGVQTLLGGIMGMQQLGLARKSLAENKRQFGLNYDAQRSTTNAMLEDRQRARVAANPGAYESVSNYMDKNKIK